MPRSTGKVRGVPSYRRHKASGQAIVVLSGEMFYLGPHGTKASHAEYDRVVSEWMARGRRPAAPIAEVDGELTIVELIAAYKRHCEAYYQKNGQVTKELSSVLSAVKPLKALYGRECVSSFGPLRLQAVQQKMIESGWVRKSINRQCQRIVRMFAWGVSQELVPAHVPAALREVAGLHKGRSAAKESDPVSPVADDVVDRTLPHLPAVVADMIRIQRLTGCRPAEVCAIRPADIDTSGPIWLYRPNSHKTEHHGGTRVICIGPKAQEILRPYLLRAHDAHCFSPADSERKRREAAHQARKTPLAHGNRPATNRRPRQFKIKDRYLVDAYRRAIVRGCELAFQMPAELREPAQRGKETAEAKRERKSKAAAWRAANVWAPNQLRHSAATEIRKQFGLEAAQVALGHAAADVTQIYAERNLALAIDVARQVG